jgi:subtilisin family serine protease
MPRNPRHRHARHRNGAGAGIVGLLAALLIAASSIGAPMVTARHRPSPTPTPVPPVIDPALEAVLAQVGPRDQVPVIVILKDQVDPRSVVAPRGERRDAALVRALKARADGTQGPLRAAVNQGRHDGEATTATALWILNGVAVTARPGLIRRLAGRPEVASILPDRSIAAPPTPAGASGGTAVEPNIAYIDAPALWDLGYRGTGVVVASMDTGVDGAHPDLATRYRGGTDSWFDPYGQHPEPTDLNGHGTMTTGVMVGGNAGGTAIGVAPDARWIAAKIFNDAGVGTSTAIHLAFQWLLDPDSDPATADAPAIVNGSWAVGAPGCNLEFEPDLQALVAAGIAPVFAAGNYGPSANTSGSPANNPDAFAVGAIDNTGRIASTSSRGPTSCGRTSSVTYPAITAPGVNIVTSDRGGFYGSASGTSLAAPHVSGALALLRQAFPTATTTQLEAALVASAADLGTAGSDNTFGAGRIDLQDAYTFLVGASATPTPTPTGTPLPTPTPTPAPTPTPTATPSPTSSPTPTPTPPADRAGPLAGLPVVAPNPANGTSAVAISVTVDDSGTGGSPITAAEWFADTAGPAGAGHAMTGSFGTNEVTVSDALSMSDLASLTDGSHSILVRGRDAAGNWGPTSSAVLVMDRTGPTASGATAASDPSQGSTTATLTGSLADSASILTGAEWFIGTDPGAGGGTTLAATDGGFDASTEAVRASVPLAGRPFGEMIISVRGRDAAGNWGPVATTAFTVTPADGVFADGFETGTTNRWSARTGTARLSVTAAAAAAGRWGLSVSIASGTHAYVTDSTPVAATAYHARFSFDARALSTANQAIDVFSGLDSKNAAIVRLQYRRAAGGVGQIRIGASRAGGTTFTAWTNLAAGQHAIELGWQSGTSTSLRLWIDGVAGPTATSLDTHSYRLETVRLGPSAGLTSSMGGELRFDRFVSSRGSTIGP